METIAMDRPEPSDARQARVKQIRDMVFDDLTHWHADFERMRYNRRFARGLQWPGMTRKDLTDPSRPYVANITMRHLKTRTASIYARNPRFTWRTSRQIHHVLWDGSAQMLAEATAMLTGTTDPVTGATVPPQPNPLAEAIVQEATEYAQRQASIKKMGETLAILYEYFLREQIFNIKHMMKRTVLQSGTCGVGYVKQTFQRVMQNSPETERALGDAKSQLDAIARLTQELAAGEIDPNEARADELRTLIADLEGKPKVLLREGLAIDFPDPLNIIPDKEMVFLPGFFGCGHVTEQYFLTLDRVKEIYGVDLKGRAQAYRSSDPGNRLGQRHDYKKMSEWQDGDRVRVFDTYHKGDGLLYTTCDGYDDFLREPAEPFPYTERFWPWFTYAPNAMDDPENPMPPSEVENVEPMQVEINAAGQGLRDHRWAARPGHVKAGFIDEEDGKRIQGRAPHQVVTLQSMTPEQKVADVLQPFPTNPIDPNLYSTGPAFEDVLRVTGTQQANLGPTSDATATEATIAQASRQSTDDSSIDELDDLLTEMARAGGQILLLNVDEATVKQIVGRGAVWPVATKEEVAREIYLEVEAGSSGKKNQAHELQVRTRMYPLLQMQPGLSVEKMNRDMLNVMDDRIQYEDWLDIGAPSVTALNGMMQAQANAGPAAADPAAQGPAGASNAPQERPAGQTGPQEPEEFTPTVQ